MAGDLQLEMNFSARQNRFKAAADQGSFSLFIECEPPDPVIAPAAGTAQLAELEAAVLGISGVNAALAITDRGGAAGSWRAVEYAAALPEANRDRHLVYLSGANTGREEMTDLLRVAGNAGSLNLVPVSGTVPDGVSVRECRKREFFDGTKTAALAARAGFFTGAAVNPFGYTPFALLAQYGALAKKLKAGAGFIVTQAGWDMLKLQSLVWYLLRRELCYPMVARLILLTPDRVEKICDGKLHGVVISRDFKRILAKELLYSRNQFEAAQYRRLALQAAGCRLLGFCGVQLAGAEYPAKAQVAAARIAEAVAEYTSFEQWLDEYNSYLASVEMSPLPDDYQMYDRTLCRPYPLDEPPDAREVEPEVSGVERFGQGVKRFLFSRADRQRPGNSFLLKKLLCGCRSCDRCHLPQTQYVCPMTCPKHLLHGPCGGMRPDGRCEMGNSECVFCTMTRLAQARGELPELEQALFPDD